ncbi:hypothetical protein ALC60_02024 [Trachymyrmex zeteki]|uniref:Uncharacterized protein n=1 Tax=Mycetomoellerius zeteki TaxID=64791 RepID=A0A151XF33_9HYME|nr:hypothetical protein ALC60_02024 [Trachymyrmex zeteki]
MYLVRKHDTGSFDALVGRSCSNCIQPMYTIFPCNVCPINAEQLEDIIDEADEEYENNPAISDCAVRSP